MAKLITIVPKEPNAIQVEEGYFPIPLQRVGPNPWHKIMSSDFGVNPINGEKLIRPTFSQVAELAGYALTDRPAYGKTGKFNPAFNSVMESINDGNQVLTGNSLMVVTPTRAFMINDPSQELSAQFGVNDQSVLEKMVYGFGKQLKGIKEVDGIVYAGDIASVSVANVSQGEQSRNPRDDNYFGNNLGLIALARSRKVAKSLAVGSRAYASEPYFSLNGEANRIVTSVPVLCANGFDLRLCVGGDWDTGNDNWCSFGHSF